MVRRLLTAAVGLPLLLGLVFLGGLWVALASAAVAAVAAIELCALVRRRGLKPWFPGATVGSGGLALALYLAPQDGYALLGVLGLGLLASLAWWALARPEAGFEGWAVTVGAALYLGLTLGHASLLRGMDAGARWLLLALLVTFAADTGAFLVGRAVGRRPLAPRLSPGKTWEGALAGILAAVAVAVALRYLLALDLSPQAAVLLGALAGVAGQVGDLAESRIKRWAGVKDSGRLLPGHGGLLDRIDSIVFNLVVVYYFLRWTAL